VFDAAIACGIAQGQQGEYMSRAKTNCRARLSFSVPKKSKKSKQSPDRQVSSHRGLRKSGHPSQLWHHDEADQRDPEKPY